MSEETRIPPPVAGDGWVRLGRAPWWTPVFFVPPVLLVLVASDAAVVSGFGHALPFVARIGVGVAVAAVVVGAVLLISRLRGRPTEVNLAEGRIRAGRQSAAFAEVTEAKLGVSTSRRRRIVFLHLRSPGGLHAGVMLRGPGGRVIDPRDAAVLGAVVERSGIRMPSSPDDPKGAFARYNFPGQRHQGGRARAHRAPAGPGGPAPDPAAHLSGETTKPPV